MKEFKPLKQMIMHVAENGVENIRIVNQFDQVVDEPANVMAEVIQKRGELNVNVNEFDMKKIEDEKQTNSVLAELGYAKLNNVEVAYSLQDQIKKGLENKSNIESLSNNINNLIIENTGEFLNLEEQIKQKVAASNNLADADQKYKLLKEAKLLMEEQQEIKDYSVDLIDLRDSISNLVNSANSIRDLDKLKSLSAQFDKLLVEGNDKEALVLLSSNRIMLQGILKDTASNLMGNMVDKSVIYDNQIVEMGSKVDGFNRDISTLQLQIQTLNNSLELSKSKEADEIKSKIASKEEEIMMIGEERDILQKSINKIRQEKYFVSQHMELLKDVISNQSLVAVSVQESNTRMQETEKPNTNSLNSFVAQQVIEIEKKDPAIKGRVVVVNNLSAQNIYSEYKSSDQGIQDDPNLNAEVRLYKMLSNERKALRMINKRLEDIAKIQQSSEGLNSQLSLEKENLENYLRELNVIVEQHELDILTVVSKDVLAETKKVNSTIPKTTSNPTASMSPQQAIAQVDPEYQSRKETINNTKGLTNQQKLESLNKEDVRMLQAVNSELSVVNDQLKKTPNDISLQNKQQALQQAKTSADEIVQKRNKEIEITKQVTANQNPVNQQKQATQSIITARNETELMTQLDSDYSSRTQKITSNQGMSDAQKVEYLNAQDNKLLTTIQNEIVKLNNDAVKNPTDQTIQAKKELLNGLKSKTELAIKSRDEQLLAVNKPIVNSVDQNKKATQVAQNENKIEPKNVVTPLTAVQVAKQIEPVKEITVVEENEPVEEIAVVKENEPVKEIAVVKENEPVKEIAVVKENEPVKEIAVVKENEPVKEIAVVKENEPVKEIAAVKENKPVKEMAVVKEIEPVKEIAVFENKQTELENDNPLQTQEQQIFKLSPKYNEEINSIENNTTLTEEQKLLQIQQKDKLLIQDINRRKDEIEKAIAKNPTNELLKKEKEQLQILSASVEAGSDEREQLITSKLNEKVTPESVEKSKAETINLADPLYEKNIAASRNTSGSDLDRSKRELKVEQDLQKNFTSQELSVRKQLEKDPTNAELLNKKQALSELKVENEKRISALNQDILNLNAGKPLISVNENDKIQEVNDLNPEYEDKQKEILSSSMSQEDKNTAMLEQEQDLRLVLVARTELLQEELKIKPNDREIKKELKVLEELKLENENRIDEFDRKIASTVIAELLPEQERVIVEKLDSLFEKEKSLTENALLPEERKQQELLAADQQLLARAYNRQEEIDQQLTNNPNDIKLKEEQRQLTALSRNLENKIEIRQQEVNRLLEISAKPAPAKESAINTLDSVSAENVSVITNSNKTEEDKNNSLLATEEELLVKVSAAVQDKTVQQEQAEIKSIAEPQVSSASKNLFVENFRKEQLKDQVGVLDTVYKTKSEIEDQDIQLSEYENKLIAALSQQEKNSGNSLSSSVETEKSEWLKSELSAVQNKRRSLKISIGELEKVEVIAENKTDQRYNDPSLNQLNSKEAQLTNNLTDNSLNKKEKQVIQKELVEVQQKQVIRENELMANEIILQNNTNETITKELKAKEGLNEATSITTRSAILYNESAQKEIMVLNEKASKTKDLQEKKYIVNEIIQKQEALNDQLRESLVENNIQQLQKENGIESLETDEALKSKKRRYTIEVGELSKIINELDQQIAASKPKQAAMLNQEKELKVEQKNLIEQQITLLDKKLTSKVNVNETLSSEAMKQNVGYAEEREIATTELYKNYVEKALPALQLEKQIITLDAQLREERSVSKQLIASSIDQPTEENKVKVQANLLHIAQMEKELNMMKQQLVNNQTLANLALPKDKTEAMKMQNLLKRGVEPIQRAALIAALVPLPASGLEINKTVVASTMTKPIPVNVKSASGLVYRVQVGAFSKPIPQDRFREFNPVSGETLNNGVTRYMAGYFNSSINALDARNKIRAIGYADAFAIAYCDGKRITLAEARALELSKQCIPKGENELVLEMAANTAEKMGITIFDSLTPAVEAMPIIAETDYNTVPGGVKADPIENHLGLFYTVQVGVFNNPINAKVISNMEPLISSRLPNGQIRYSSGMFNSIDESRPKKQEAIDKGIKDAFITAYYKSQRITLAEAEQILKDKGETVLESKQTPKNIPNTSKGGPANPRSAEPIKSEIKIDLSLLVTETKKIEKVQIVTKKTFDEFPREILNRYNSQGSFYYDENDKKVKSAIADSKESLPQVFYFKDDIDTVYVQNSVDEKVKVVKVEFMGSSLPGDFSDWLLRYNYRREFKRNDLKTELRIFDVPEDKVPVLIVKLESFGLKGTIE